MSLSLTPIVYQTPKRTDLGYVLLGDARVDIALGTTKPATPTYSFKITSLPSYSGDPLYRPRYMVIAAFTTYNSTSSAITGYGEIYYNGSLIYSASPSEAAYAGSGYVIAKYCNLNDTIDFYGWAAATGLYLRYVFCAVIILPKVSNKFSSVFATRVNTISRYAYCYGSNVNAPSNIGLSHNDIAETTLSASGFAKLSNVAAPSLYSDELITRASGSSAATLNVLIPSVVVWTE